MSFDVASLLVGPTSLEVEPPTPEQALFCAVFQCAVDDILRYLNPETDCTAESYRLADRAQLWIKKDNTEPLSFIWTAKVVFGRYPGDFDLHVIENCRKNLLMPLPKPTKH